MEIAATGLALPLFGPARDRPQATPNDATRSRERQANGNDSAAGRNNERAGNERVIRGEVLSSQTESARSVENVQRSDQSTSGSFNSSNTRQFSIQSAIQTFQDNEALVSDPATPRQVSGIIDVFV